MGLEPVTPTPNGKEGIVYCYKKNAAETIVITNDTGKFTIQGLAPGAYELVEKEAPKGYNKLSAPVEITIGNEGRVSYNTVTNAKWVKVENKPVPSFHPQVEWEQLCSTFSVQSL